MKPGITHQMAHLIDIMPTFVEIGGATYPARARSQAVQPMEGESLAAVFKGGSLAPRTLFGSTRAIGPSAAATGNAWPSMAGPGSFTT